MNLIPIEQKTITFYGDEITVVQIENGSIMVPIKPICEALGVDWSSQAKRINRDDVLAEVQGMVIMTTPGGTQKMKALPIGYVNGWLFGLTVSKVKPEFRESLKRYKRDVHHVLAKAFGRGEVTAAPSPIIDDLLAKNTQAAQAYKMVMAMAEMARQQVLMEATLGQHGTRLDEHEKRLQLIEADSGDSTQYISNAQAAELSQAVKTIALELGKQSGKNEFAGVYGELYRRFKIPSYKVLPTVKFDEAMSFLRQWWESITTNDMPF